MPGLDHCVICVHSRSRDAMPRKISKKKLREMSVDKLLDLINSGEFDDEQAEELYEMLSLIQQDR
jgi:hypothetical protein